MMYLEDLEVGAVFQSGSHTLTESEIIQFASVYDPQPFHTDPVAAKDTFFQGLCASGWHTAAVTMKLFVTGEFQLVGGQIGAGVDQLKWPVPTRPGDTLSVESRVLETRQLKSRPDRGLARVEITARNQRGEIAQQMVANVLAFRRPTPPLSGA